MRACSSASSSVAPPSRRRPRPARSSRSSARSSRCRRRAARPPPALPSRNLPSARSVSRSAVQAAARERLAPASSASTRRVVATASSVRRGGRADAAARRHQSVGFSGVRRERPLEMGERPLRRRPPRAAAARPRHGRAASPAGRERLGAGRPEELHRLLVARSGCGFSSMRRAERSRAPSACQPPVEVGEPELVDAPSSNVGVERTASLERARSPSPGAPQLVARSSRAGRAPAGSRLDLDRPLEVAPPPSPARRAPAWMAPSEKCGRKASGPEGERALEVVARRARVARGRAG